jgi:hypothetical protein
MKADPQNRLPVRRSFRQAFDDLLDVRKKWP